ncbi:MAG TPA: protein translocase subunit SecF [Thermoanaerobaculia bacterium]|nr:protein translocase subunit SecF [Thermoanaerobaculia bacterium]
MEFLRDTNYDFMKYRKFWVVVSLLLVGIAIFSVFFHGKLNIGVDFAGGTQIRLKFREQPDINRIRTVLAGQGLGDATIQSAGDDEGANEVMIRTRLVEGKEEGSRDQVMAALDKAYNAGIAGKPDLNKVGAGAVAAVLAQANPDRVAGDAAAHYDGVAKTILDKRKDLGLFKGWNDLSGPGVSPAVVSALQQRAALGTFALQAVENVGPQIGEELRRQGFWAVILSLIGMMVYIWIRFELRFGIGAIMACIHDVLVTLGLYAIAGFEFNLTTIAAFLTLIGYSVNDTVVIFDRVRENMRKTRRKPMIEILNDSINQTLSRTILTGGSTLLALAALLVWGGDVIRGFAFVMFVGILVGTYSSIYVASPFTLLWEQYFGGQGRLRKGATPTAATEPGAPRPESTRGGESRPAARRRA